MSDKKLKVTVLMGGPSSEHEISLATGKVIMGALDQQKYDLTPLTIGKEGKWVLPSAEDTDVVVIAMHGAYGEDGTVQGMLEVEGIPYTGSGVLASALAMHKVKSNEIYSFHQLPVPDYVHFSQVDLEKREWEIMDKIRGLGLPCVIKPVNLGSSVGVTILKDIEALADAIEKVFSHGSDAMAQKYIKGIEVTCAVLDEGDGKEPIALPPTQIIPKTAEFFDYDAKYTVGGSEEITPPNLPPETIARIQEIALRAHRVLGCAGMSRTDMIVDGNDVYILETNTIPGMTETSLYPQAAAAVGISFPDLLDKLIQSALHKKH